MALLTFGLFPTLFQMMNNETPIRVYRLIQTGLKSQLGGEKAGFFKVAYQIGMAGMVKKDPKKPADWQRAILATNFIIFISSYPSLSHLNGFLNYNSIIPLFFNITFFEGLEGKDENRGADTFFRIIHTPAGNFPFTLPGHDLQPRIR